MKLMNFIIEKPMMIFNMMKVTFGQLREPGCWHWPLASLHPATLGGIKLTFFFVEEYWNIIELSQMMEMEIANWRMYFIPVWDRIWLFCTIVRHLVHWMAILYFSVIRIGENPFFELSSWKSNSSSLLEISNCNKIKFVRQFCLLWNWIAGKLDFILNEFSCILIVLLYC